MLKKWTNLRSMNTLCTLHIPWKYTHTLEISYPAFVIAVLLKGLNGSPTGQDSFPGCSTVQGGIIIHTFLERSLTRIGKKVHRHTTSTCYVLFFISHYETKKRKNAKLVMQCYL